MFCLIDGFMAMVGQSLAGAGHVTQVAVSFNNLGVEGGKALAECLQSNTTITQVC